MLSFLTHEVPAAPEALESPGAFALYVKKVLHLGGFSGPQIVADWIWFGSGRYPEIPLSGKILPAPYSENVEIEHLNALPTTDVVGYTTRIEHGIIAVKGGDSRIESLFKGLGSVAFHRRRRLHGVYAQFLYGSYFYSVLALIPTFKEQSWEPLILHYPWTKVP